MGDRKRKSADVYDLTTENIRGSRKRSLPPLRNFTKTTRPIIDPNHFSHSSPLPVENMLPNQPDTTKVRFPAKFQIDLSDQGPREGSLHTENKLSKGLVDSTEVVTSSHRLGDRTLDTPTSAIPTEAPLPEAAAVSAFLSMDRQLPKLSEAMRNEPILPLIWDRVNHLVRQRLSHEDCGERDVAGRFRTFSLGPILLGIYILIHEILEKFETHVVKDYVLKLLLYFKSYRQEASHYRIKKTAHTSTLDAVDVLLWMTARSCLQIKRDTYNAEWLDHEIGLKQGSGLEGALDWIHGGITYRASCWGIMCRGLDNTSKEAFQVSSDPDQWLRRPQCIRHIKGLIDIRELVHEVEKDGKANGFRKFPDDELYAVPPKNPSRAKSSIGELKRSARQIHEFGEQSDPKSFGQRQKRQGPDRGQDVKSSIT